MEGNEKQKLLREIQLCQFAVVEANLFLDTHPCDQDALAYYKKHSGHLKELLAEYEEKYGRVVLCENGQMRWAWVDNPWPWQMEG